MSTDYTIEPFDHFLGRLKSGNLGPNFLEVKSERSDQARDYLLKYYDDFKATDSARDAGGAVFDFVPRDAQPSLQATGEAIATPPEVAAFQDFDEVPAPGVLGAKDDTSVVPIRRIEPDEILRLGGVESFTRKYPLPRANSLLLAATPTQHRYAHAYQQVENLGGRSVMNVWAPRVPAAGFSLAQHWYVADGQKGVQTVEVGWQVCPQKYGHGKPVLFTYWTPDGYITGAYNNDRHDFVVYSHSSTVGMALPAVSALGGVQAELALMFVLHQGNWWLFVNGADQAHAIGYYPTTLFNGGPLATHATEIDYGGETVPFDTYPPMGSGQFANKGAGQAAYQRNIEFMTNAGFSAAALTPVQQYSDEYTIAMGTTPTAGEFFYFGGPGGPP